MDKPRIEFNFYPANDDDNYNYISLTYECNTLHIREFHDFCKRFAAALGYEAASIEEYFGETVHED